MLLTNFLTVVDNEFNFAPEVGNSLLNIHKELVLDKCSASL